MLAVSMKDGANTAKFKVTCLDSATSAKVLNEGRSVTITEITGS